MFGLATGFVASGTLGLVKTALILRRQTGQSCARPPGPRRLTDWDEDGILVPGQFDFKREARYAWRCMAQHIPGTGGKRGYRRR